MSIFKNDIPILEYDNDQAGVIAANHEHESLHLPERALFAFLGEAVDRYAKAHGAVIVDHYETISKLYPIYVLEKDGQQICLVEAPVGAPAATAILDALIACGVRKIISGGSCGVLVPMEENVFLIPRKALRDEGTSYHYLPPERFVTVSEAARKAIAATLQSRHLPFSEVVTWSTDGFFRETKGMVEYRKSEGCSVVEMECAALAACAQFRGAAWGELLFTADTLANAERYDARDWGRDSIDLALELCMEAVLHL
ncbi:MAG: nucleoside phosphorylase [Oscillospiraceae bacterium]|nr:nucleoside phosphorylase [Oscillospiraceae bacterium]